MQAKLCSGKAGSSLADWLWSGNKKHLWQVKTEGWLGLAFPAGFVGASKPEGWLDGSLAKRGWERQECLAGLAGFGQQGWLGGGKLWQEGTKLACILPFI